MCGERGGGRGDDVWEETSHVASLKVFGVVLVVWEAEGVVGRGGIARGVLWLV